MMATGTSFCEGLSTTTAKKGLDNLRQLCKYTKCTYTNEQGLKNMLSTGEVAKCVGISKNTLLRWLECGLVEDVERDWRGWRIWQHRDIERIKTFQVAYHSKPRERMRRSPIARAAFAKDAALSMGSFGRGYIEKRGIRE
jgi:hypothetical protein